MADRYSPPSTESEGSYHSAHGDEVWVHERNIGTGGFGVVKLFVNQVRQADPGRGICLEGTNAHAHRDVLP